MNDLIPTCGNSTKNIDLHSAFSRNSSRDGACIKKVGTRSLVVGGILEFYFPLFVARSSQSLLAIRSRFICDEIVRESLRPSVEWATHRKSPDGEKGR